MIFMSQLEAAYLFHVLSSALVPDLFDEVDMDDDDRDKKVSGGPQILSFE